MVETSANPHGVDPRGARVPRSELGALQLAAENAAVVVAVGADSRRIVGLAFAFLGAFRVVHGGFRGSGSTRTAMASSILALVVFRVPPAHALVEWFNPGATGASGNAITCSNVAILAVAGPWVRRHTWATGLVAEGPGPPGMGHGGGRYR